MKLATLFTIVTLLTTLSCLPNYGASSIKKQRKLQAEAKKAEQPIKEPEIKLPVTEAPVTEAPVPKPEPELEPEDTKKLNILILTLPTPGHISVPLALAEELARRGYHVTFSTSSNKSQAAAEKVGVAFKSSCSKDSLMEAIRRFEGKEKTMREIFYPQYME